MMEAWNLGELFSLGFLGSLHCVGMCGGFVLVFSSRSGIGSKVLYYHLARLVSYVLMGGVVGWAGEMLSGLVPAWVMWSVFGGVMVSMGLGLMGITRRWENSWPARGMSRLVVRGAARFLRTDSPLSPWVVGLFTGLLPCGLLYAGLAKSAVAGTPWSAMGSMAAFWLGTLPALLGITVVAPFLKTRWWRKVWPYLAGGVTVFLGSRMLFMAYRALQGGSCCNMTGM